MTIPTEAIAPIITSVLAVVVAVLGGIMARRSQKLGNIQQRAPDVQQMWSQQETDRRMRRRAEDIWWNIRRAFQTYYRRVNLAVLKLDLTPEQTKEFDLTMTELKAIEAELPEEEQED